MLLSYNLEFLDESFFLLLEYNRAILIFSFSVNISW